MDFAEVDGYRVRHSVTGPAGGPVVVLLHGLGRSLEDWEPLRAELPAHRVLALDLPGFGRSQPLPDLRLPALAGHVARTLDRLGVTEPAHVVGNSLGGAVAMRLAVHAPARVASLALANSAGFGREVTWALRILDLPLLWRFLLVPGERGARSAERSLHHDPSFATPERIALALELARRPGAAVTLRRVARSLGSVGGVRAGWRRELLTAVRALGIPTLVVWGSHDRILPAAHLANASAALPGARTRLFPCTGHLPQIERAGEFAALLESFWSGPGAGRTGR
ncbi:alpha/beta fold hydrolase [Streptomyces sp. CAU 1734]|uniref:alpha/beta fold hydrolase n=1 Tax=Streptomyces sp. CAU 1734 TaxID=3140360 RepID=UPI003260682F